MLRHTGGAKERDCVTRCLEKVFSNYLGQYCSWTGKKNNYKLSSMNLMSTIKREYLLRYFTALYDYYTTWSSPEALVNLFV